MFGVILEDTRWGGVREGRGSKGGGLEKGGRRGWLDTCSGGNITQPKNLIFP